MPTRPNFHSSTLLRCLAELAMTESADSGAGFAEKLGTWIHFTDAITLSAVHGEGLAARPDAVPGMQVSMHAAAHAEFERTQSNLSNAIIRNCTPNAVKTRIPLPAPETVLPLDLGAVYTAYRRFYEAHQRDMEMGIQPLRVNVRDALANASPRLRKLADLDATLERILRERERKLLAKVPLLLKQRFEHLYQQHRQRAATGQADDPAAWTRAGGWLARFRGDLQMLLLAELELRLQPTIGLIEACKNEPQ
jgi:hypothetical protein